MRRTPYVCEDMNEKDGQHGTTSPVERSTLLFPFAKAQSSYAEEIDGEHGSAGNVAWDASRTSHSTCSMKPMLYKAASHDCSVQPKWFWYSTVCWLALEASRTLAAAAAAAVSTMHWQICN